ncbi:MAG: GNAT family N-acetyltransferase [Cytophagia bacterium]|nr:GNAT family N-acetyltransferase [Cytophagia bacterium]
MSTAVRRYEAKVMEEWNSFLKGSVHNSFLFDRNYMDYHSDRFIDHSLMIYEDDQLLALFPANQNESEIQSHGGLSYGGFILGEEVKLHQVLKIFYHVLEYYNQKGCKSMLYKTFPAYLCKVPSQSDFYALFLLEASLVRRDPACVVDMMQPLNYQHRRVRSIQKAAKVNAWVRQNFIPNFFWNEILSPTLWSRHQLKPVHTLNEIDLLMKRFTSNIKLFECGIGESPTAGVLIFENDTVAHAQYIATTNEGRKSGTLDFLFDRLIKDTFADKRFFSFGISTEEYGKVLNNGLQDWKEGFGSRTFILDYYKIKIDKFHLLAKYA